MDTKQRAFDTVLTLLLGLGNVLITYIDIVSKIVALFVGLLSAAYLIWKWRRDIKKENQNTIKE